MQEVDLPGLAAQVLWAAFILALAFGALAQRTHFCTMGAVSDILNLGDWGRMRMWVLAIAVAVVGFNAMVGLGWVEAGKSVYASSRLLPASHAVGGLMFGFGMVLASGCGSRSLVRAGSGNLKSVVVLLVLALASAAAMRGLFGVWRVNTLDTLAFTLPVGQDLPSLLAHATGTPRAMLAPALGLALGLALLVWVLWRPEGRSADVLVGGAGVGALVVALWWVSGRLGHLSEHPQTLEEAFLATNSGRMESFTFVAPVAYAVEWVTLFSDKSRVLTLGVVSAVGVALGAASMALATGTFRWEGFGGAEDTANHLVGATLMGVGGVTAMGCTVGQGITGVSTLALGSLITLPALVAGAVLAMRYQIWRIERQSLKPSSGPLPTLSAPGCESPPARAGRPH